MEFIITIDTEGDNQWDHGRELTVENIRFVPRFQDLCNKYLIKPTYLVTSEVCKDNFAKEIFTDYLLTDKAEIGTHLHSWTTPPFKEKDGYRYNDLNHAFATELPEDLLTEKIKNITNQIETSFGKRPLSFRSGRFGFNGKVARILINNLYLVDSSVTPYINWLGCEGIPGGMGGPDFIDNL
ncbi:MAG TPA: deacetylase, partial [Ignavibacteria bacterium]